MCFLFLRMYSTYMYNACVGLIDTLSQSSDVIFQAYWSKFSALLIYWHYRGTVQIHASKYMYSVHIATALGRAW